MHLAVIIVAVIMLIMAFMSWKSGKQWSLEENALGMGVTGNSAAIIYGLGGLALLVSGM